MFNRNKFHTLEWDYFKLIAKEIPKIKQVFLLEANKAKFYFAPDFSELFNYIFPARDISLPTLDEDLRHYHATRMMLEQKEKKKVLIPPYVRELEFHYQHILTLQQEYNHTDWVKTIDNLLNDKEFNDKLSEIEKEKTNTENIIGIISLAKKHEKKLARLLDILATYNNSIGRLKDLINKRYIDYVDKDVNLKIIEHALENSNKWFEVLEAKRKRDSKDTAHSSLIDAWAIEYLRQTNSIAINDFGNVPFLIYITRSRFVREVAEDALSFYIPGLSSRLCCSWSSDTFLSYHIFNQMPERTSEKINNALDEVYGLYKSENQINNQVREGLTRYWGDPDMLSKEIDNISSLYEDINRVPTESLEKIKKNPEYAEYNVLSNLITVVKTQKSSPIEFQLKIDNYLRILWEQLANVDDVVHNLLDAMKHEGALPQLCIEYLNNIPHVFIKLAHLSIMVRIQDQKIIDNIKSKSLTPKNFYKVSKSLSLDKEYLWLLEIAIHLYFNEINDAEEKYSLLPGITVKEIEYEAKLLKLSIDFLRSDEIDVPINNCTKLMEEGVFPDPRAYKLLGIFYWKKWEQARENQYLEFAYKYTDIAFKLIKDKATDYKLECINNRLYIEAQMFENSSKRISISALRSELNILKKLVEEIYENNMMPPSIHHTIGIVEYIIASSDKKMKKENRAQLALSARTNLAIPLILGEFYPEYHERYLTDFNKVKELLQGFLQSD